LNGMNADAVITHPKIAAAHDSNCFFGHRNQVNYESEICLKWFTFYEIILLNGLLLTKLSC